jgi:hypothetical protein
LILIGSLTGVSLRILASLPKYQPRDPCKLTDIKITRIHTLYEKNNLAMIHLIEILLYALRGECKKCINKFFAASSF